MLQRRHGRAGVIQRSARELSPFHAGALALGFLVHCLRGHEGRVVLLPEEAGEPELEIIGGILEPVGRIDGRDLVGVATVRLGLDSAHQLQRLAQPAERGGGLQEAVVVAAVHE